MEDILEKLRAYGDLLPGVSFDIVNRHPLADETELLKNLDLTAEDCDFCDVLWAFEGKINFISFFSTIKTIKKSHVFYRFDMEALNGGNHFYVATVQFPLKKIHIENGLKYLSRWLTDEGTSLEKIKHGKKVLISSEDICK